jgi:hypothetical protein
MRQTDVYDCAEVLKRHSLMIERALFFGAFGLGGGPFNPHENDCIHALVRLGSVLDSGWVICPDFERVLTEERAAQSPDTPTIMTYQRVLKRHVDWMVPGQSLAPWRAEASRIRSEPK